MTWFSILKYTEAATADAKNIIKEHIDIMPKHNVKVQLEMIKILGGKQDIELVKSHIRENIEKTYLNERMIKAWFMGDPDYSRRLVGNGHSFEDVDWKEVMIPIVAIYDKIIDGLTEADL